MSSFKVLLCIAFGLLALSSTIDAMCRVCSSISYAACINETSFFICFDGQVLSSQLDTCKENTVCTESAGVCKPKIPGVVLGCQSDMCNQCVGTFGCVSQTQFTFCRGDGTSGHMSSCEKGKVCSVQQFMSGADICAKSCLVEPTCQNTEPVPPPVGDWKDTCLQIDSQPNGYYINVHDFTCKTFVYCETLNEVMNSVKYDCGANYFDVVSKTCIEKKPATCS